MRKYILFIIFISSTVLSAYSQRYTVAGKIMGSKEKNAIEFATVLVSENGIWAITNNKGEFSLSNLPAGKFGIKVNSLGYASKTFEVDVRGNMSGVLFQLEEDNLALDEVVITAKRKTDDMTTTYVIDRVALDHNQILSISDIGSLLPGGKTNRELNLAKTDDRISLHSNSTGEFGNSSFGTAIEVDGVRIQNNATFDETKGTSTRNIGTINIESIEVVAGIPSVEYGDLTSGLIKVNTKKGETPFTLDLSTKPHTKQAALSKGFLLGPKAGIVNASFEYTKSTSDLASPHKAYDRNILTLNYTNTFNQKNGMPLRLTAGFTGNVGGYDSKADPDAYANTYTKKRDNTFRGNVKLNWLLNKSWITNLEGSGSISYSDKVSRINSHKSSSYSQSFIHSTEEGYFIASLYDENNQDAPIILGPVDYWYELAYRDNKPINYSAKLKADWVRKFNIVTNRLMIGGEFDRSGNKGRGLYYDDMRYAPTWREDRYDNKPYMNNFAWYAEDKVTLPVTPLSTLEVMAGIRSDITRIKGTEYGTVQTFSPRLNAKYTFWENRDQIVSSLSIRAGWGKAVKLPSFEVLYPTTSYADDLAFAAGTMDDGTSFTAYYTRPNKAIYNSDLKWQYSKQSEIGLEATICGTRISVSAFRSKTYNPYMATNVYMPYSYNYTDPSALEEFPISSENRIYSIDKQTGIVTVSDKTGAIPTQSLDYTTKNDYQRNRTFVNGSPVERRGIDWSISFPQIPALRTSILLNGNFYRYKGVEETLTAWKPSSTSSESYKYIGYYIGNNNTSTSSVSTMDDPSSPNSPSNSVANGKLSKEINANITIKTHIPKIRLVVSLTIESSLYNYSRNLSEYSGGKRGVVLEKQSDYTGLSTDIYGGDRFVAVYPLYYSTWDEPNVKIPFEEKFLWAKDNDKKLYNELTKLVTKTNVNYYFNPNRISSYFSANINVTKEIGKYASISFYANNFLNNMSRIKSSQSNTETTLYNSTYIPKFYYGLSLRLKL